MPVTFLRCKTIQRAVAVLLLVMMVMQNLSARAQQSGLTFEICNPPPVCFATQEAKQAWAAENHCRFIEDVCDKNPASTDNKGASDADQGFWGNAWRDVKNGLIYGYEFVKGVVTGLKNQVADLLDLIVNLDAVVMGLIDLGKAFYNDPKGTLIKLGELLGQEAIDAITKATQCGPYDLGKVIGTYVSPATMLRLATRLTKYGGKLAEAVRATKLELGCASFAAGTPVQTPEGTVPIEQITTGMQVLSRHERSYADKAQPVTQKFGRIAPSYRELQTEFDTLRLTDEHPLWVQSKGWTLAKDVTDDDVIAGLRGDALVLRNTAVARPLRVYNFSVASTENYFVGVGGAWAHNAKCKLDVNKKGITTKFEEIISKMSANDRVAYVTIAFRDVVKENGWRKRGDLSSKNIDKSGFRREIYEDLKSGNFFAFDTQHGRFEKLDRKGKHLGEYDIELNFIKDSIVSNGSHDIRL